MLTRIEKFFMLYYEDCGLKLCYIAPPQIAKPWCLVGYPRFELNRRAASVKRSSIFCSFLQVKKVKENVLII